MTGTSKKGGEQSPPRAGNKKEQKPLTLEILQECARRAGAPPLGDTYLAKGVVDELNSHRPPAMSPKGDQHKTKVRAAIKMLDMAVSEKIQNEEGIIRLLFSQEESVFRAKLIPIREKYLIELKLVQNAMTLARKFFVDDGIKPGTHSGLKIDNTSASFAYILLKMAWEQNGQKPPSAAKTYGTIWRALAKVGVDVSVSAIRDAVKAAEKPRKNRRKAAE